MLKMQKIKTILFVFFFFTTSAILFLFAVIIKLTTFLFDRNLTFLHYFTLYWARIYLAVNPEWKIVIRGIENLKPNYPCVYISNHQSYFDIMLISFLNIPYKWVSRSEIFNIPFIGWNMWLNNYIGLKRGNKKSIIQMLERSNNAIDKGNSIFIFPEGTRSLTGQLQKFKSGAFVLAKKKGIPIVPIVINGTKNILNKENKRLNFRSNLSINVLPAITSDIISSKSIDELSEFVHAEMTKYIVV